MYTCISSLLDFPPSYPPPSHPSRSSPNAKLISLCRFPWAILYMVVYVLEKKTATHSSILAWRIPWTEKPGKLKSMWSKKIHTWLSNWTSTTINFKKSKSWLPWDMMAARTGKDKRAITVRTLLNLLDNACIISFTFEASFLAMTFCPWSLTCVQGLCCADSFQHQVVRKLDNEHARSRCADTCQAMMRI